MRPEGESRKARSIERLRREGVPVINHLPWIECDPTQLQSLESIANRTMVICLLAVHAEREGMPRAVLDQYLDLRGVRGHLTANELKFLSKTEPTDSERGPFTWQYECAHVFLWSMGYVEALGSPTIHCTAQGVSSIIAPRSVAELVVGARMRSPQEIFDECDLVFRYHWAARNAYLRGQDPPAGLLSGVCFYRHYALNWLADNNADWDNVDTST